MAVHWLPLDEGVTSLPPRIDASVMAAPGLCRSLLARALMDWWMPIISPVPCFGSWLCADCPLVKVSPLWTTVAEGLTCPSIVLLFKFYIDIQISLEAPPPPPPPRVLYSQTTPLRCLQQVVRCPICPYNLWYGRAQCAFLYSINFQKEHKREYVKIIILKRFDY